MSRWGQRGSAIPFAVACLGVLLMLGGAGGVVGALVAGHRSAQAAADLAALAGAAALQSGADPCAAAARTAHRNGAELATCRPVGDALSVVTRVEGPRWLGWHADLRAEARAGPGVSAGT